LTFKAKVKAKDSHHCVCSCAVIIHRESSTRYTAILRLLIFPDKLVRHSTRHTRMAERGDSANAVSELKTSRLLHMCIPYIITCNGPYITAMSTRVAVEEIDSQKGSV